MNYIYFKQIFIIIVFGALLGLFRNFLLDSPLDLIKVKKVASSFDGTELPDEFLEPLSINLEMSYALYNSKAIFIDARVEDDYKNEHIKNAINIPFETYEDYEDEIFSFDEDTPLVLYCGGGECELSTNLAYVLFDDYEFEKVLIFKAGYPSWKESGYPIE